MKCRVRGWGCARLPPLISLEVVQWCFSSSPAPSHSPLHTQQWRWGSHIVDICAYPCLCYMSKYSLQCCTVLGCFSRVWLFPTIWTVACQAPLSVGFSRQEYWSGLPWPSPGDLPDPRIESMSLMSPASADRFFTSSSRDAIMVISEASR